MSMATENRKKREQGFSVITVIVAVAFIGIMAMTVLYTSTANFQMKATDLKAKDSFYTAENALDEIRAGLQEEVGEAMSDAYVEVLEAYNDENTGNVESLDQVRQEAFQRSYLKKLQERLKDGSDITQYDRNRINDYVDMTGRLPEGEHLKLVNPGGAHPMVVDTVNPGIILKNLKVIYVDARGRASMIETNIRLGMPKVVFPTPSTLPDLMNMIVAADKGIVFGEPEQAENTELIRIKGSIYAGAYPADETGTAVSMSVCNGQNVTVESGERLVCLGELRLGNDSSFLNTGGTDLWAQGLTVTSGTVELTGRTYLADDLTLNTTVNRSTGSHVKISGEYYGYGSRESAKGSHFGDGEDSRYGKLSDTALDSAIIVNGRGSILDLSGVTRLMLAGNSYVGSTKLNAGEAYSNSRDVMTGESLTVRGNQLAYLADPECFAEEGQTNPMTYDEYLDFSDRELIDLTKPVRAWGGKSLSELGVDTAEPVLPVFYQDVSGAGFVYFYLNFTDSGNASKFFEEYYNNETIKKNMDKYLNFYLGEKQGITMKDKNGFLRFVTRGNVLTYDGGDGTNGQGNLESAADPVWTAEQRQEQINLQNMWFALTRKMITSYDLLRDEVKKADGPSHSEKDPNRFVYENLVDEAGLREFLAQQGGGASHCFTVTGETETLSAWVADTPEFVIDSDRAASTRLVVATGDVIIEKGVSFKGIIMAGGTLFMKPGSSLISAPLEAAKVFQAQRESAEETVPMDFFWEGEKYVLGNSLIDRDTTEGAAEKDSYDLSACISYEEWTKK